MPRVPSLDHLPEKIKESCARLAGLQADAAKERNERNRLIVAAVDQAGMSVRVVARYAGMSTGTVMRVLGTPDTEQD